MSDLFILPALADDDADRPTLAATRDPGYVALVDAAIALGLLCTCGGTTGGRCDSRHGDNDPRIPPREDGRPRGACGCWRRRARTTPVNANR